MAGYPRSLPLLLLICMLLLGAAVERRAIVITRNGNLSFGSMQRGESVTIDYDDSRAGEYIIQGEESVPFRLSLVASSIRNESEGIQLILSNVHCGYSYDNGVTWTTFAGEELTQDLRFPQGENGAGMTAVRVRIGGRFVAGTLQRRGEYSGNLMVTAEYLVEGGTAGKSVR